MMNEEDTIDLYEAIRQMKLFTSRGEQFSFTHATYNRDSDTSDGIRHVARAILRPAAKGDDLAQADYKLFYMDEVIGKPRNCWQMLIMEFNNKKVVLN